MCIVYTYTPYAHSDPQNPIDSVQSTFKGLWRMGNLVSTVGIICLDYGTAIAINRKTGESNSELSRQLKEAREVHERVSIRRWRSTALSKEEIDDLDAQILENVKKIRKIAEDLAAKEEQVESSSPFSPVHSRSAERLLRLCETNGGVYIKLGQHLAQLDYLLPNEFILSLRRLLNDTPRSSIESVRRTIFEETGSLPEEKWAVFDPEPIASASLAQVHVAYDAKGRKYAVKVQHEGLSETAASDMRAVTVMVDLVARIFKGFSYKWLAREMNTNLPLELDFVQEARNIEQCRSLLYPLIESGDLALPKVFHSSKRVLVMSFEEGCYMTDTEKLRDTKLDPSEVARLISKTFCEQIYRHGFVHCDPHTANVLVRVSDSPVTLYDRLRSLFSLSPRPQIVLLDHGLYRQLDDKFRRDYCRLWRGLVTSDLNEIKRCAGEMNAGDMYPLLAAMLTLRPWDDIVSHDMTRLRNTGSRREKASVRFYAKRYFMQIVDLMEHVPSALLLLLKTNDCLRQLDKSVGTPINTITVVASTTADVIFHEDIQNCNDWGEVYTTCVNYVLISARVFALEAASIWLKVIDYTRKWWSSLFVLTA